MQAKLALRWCFLRLYIFIFLLHALIICDQNNYFQILTLASSGSTIIGMEPNAGGL